MKTFSLIALSVTLVIGPGIFTVPGLALGIGGFQGALSGWLLTAVLMLPFILIFATFHAKDKSNAGLSHWIGSSLGADVQHGVLLTQLATNFLYIPCSVIAATAYFGKAIHIPGDKLLIASIAFSLGAFLLVSFGERMNSLLGRLSLLGTLSLLLTILYYRWGNLTSQSAFSPSLVSTNGGFFTPIKVSAILVMSFVGWESLSNTCQKQGYSQQQISKAYLFSFALISLLYFGVALTLGFAYRNGEAVNSYSGFFPLIHSLPGLLGKFFPLLLCVIILANLTGWFRSTIRILSEIRRQYGWQIEASPGNQSVEKLTVLSILLIGLCGFDKELVTAPQFIQAANLSFLLIYSLISISYFKQANSYPHKSLGLFALFAAAVMISGIERNWLSLIPVVALAVGTGLGYRKRWIAVSNYLPQAAQNHLLEGFAKSYAGTRAQCV